jgi:alkylation response protein AidB-like acyl-CoA dehydrogenase
MGYEEYKAAGLSFLIDAPGKTKIFAPEYFNEEQLEVARLAEEFVKNDIFPIMERLEAKEEGLLLSMVKKSGELGLLSIDVPEKYEGAGMDKATSMLACEKLVPAGCFAVALLTHTGIGTLPLVYFGTHELKQKYLPGLSSGELIGCYGLTETGSGSDALGAKTKAVLSGDGTHYVLNGEKMFITNAGIADICFVFAKIDGDKFTGFVVEMGWDGVSTGAEEHKMGIHGSSTRTVVLEDVKVPVGNLLGEIGKGHRIAFNILNIGRFKLGVGCLGAAKMVMEVAAKYANERHQFKRPISSFGAIRGKLAHMMARCYALECMSYRTAGLMDAAIETIDKDADDAEEKVIRAIEEYAIEASIMKVYGSETLDYVADEGVQIHGGYGYIAEYVVERAYRDSRINRIFEGTNEINRLLIPGTMLKNTLKGRFPMPARLKEIQAEIADASKRPAPPSGPLADRIHAVLLAKRGALFACNLANEAHMMDIMEHKKGQTQMAMLDVADLIMESYACDSVVARTLQLTRDGGETKAAIPLALMDLYLAESLDRIRSIGRRLVHNASPPEAAAGNVGVFDSYLTLLPANTHDLQERIGAHLVARERYALE